MEIYRGVHKEGASVLDEYLAVSKVSIVSLFGSALAVRGRRLGDPAADVDWRVAHVTPISHDRREHK
jgi:hypothetical protein